ncbi:hypothetical protein [Streptomyces tardus]|uniref:hypothetical protein n=1 Tax=Streptomyces tardus TaxID=2780544 RepID=UPI001F3481DF|nr:hypothetical protein [Streptomyces tardus]
MASDAEASHARKRRLLFLGGGGMAAVALAAVIAVAVVAQGRDDDGSQGALPTPEELPSSQGPKPTFESKAPPPPPNPTDFITDPKKDTAPLSAKRLFSTAEVSVNGRTYLRRGTANTTTCENAAGGGLSAALKSNACKQLHRATFIGGGRVVTVGVALFDTRAQARATAGEAQQISPLDGSGVSEFCQTSACHVSANSVGRYAYFTVAGYENGKDAKAGDTAQATGRDLAKYTFEQIHQRGEDQADKAYAEQLEQDG